MIDTSVGTKLAGLTYLLRFNSVVWLSTKPSLYYGIRRVAGLHDHLCIRRDTALVIEGFPRSANSSTVQGVVARQKQPMHVAHHKHHAAQILRAVQWGIPAVVLIREPRSACMSLLALAAETRLRMGTSRDRGLSFDEVFSAYVAFYEAVEPHLEKTVIGRFDVIRDDLAGLIQRVNARFGTDFEAREPDDAPPVDLGWHALPSEQRNQLKQDIGNRFDEEFAKSGKLRRLVARAEAVHARYREADEHYP